jgi:hypothetical protein
MTRDEIESRVTDLEAEARYADDDPGELYMKMLESSSPFGDSFPGAREEYLRRYRTHKRREKRRERRRAERYGEDES